MQPRLSPRSQPILFIHTWYSGGAELPSTHTNKHHAGRHSTPRPTALITHQRMALAGAQARIVIHITPGAALCAAPNGAHHAPAHCPGGRAGAYRHSHHAWGGNLCHAPRRSSRTSAWPWRARWREFSFTSRLGRHSVPRPSALITHERMALAGALARIFIHNTPGVALCATPLGAHHAPAHGPGGRACAYLHSHHAWGGTLCHAPRRSSRTSALP